MTAITNISNISFEGTSVRFDVDDKSYYYTPVRGSLYIGGCGTPVHQTRDSSFEISEQRTLDEVLSYARLLGAHVRPARTLA